MNGAAQAQAQSTVVTVALHPMFGHGRTITSLLHRIVQTRQQAQDARQQAEADIAMRGK